MCECVTKCKVAKIILSIWPETLSAASFRLPFQLLLVVPERRRISFDGSAHGKFHPLRAFVVHYPQAHFDLRPYIHQAASQQLQRGEIDLCISGAPIEQRSISWVPLQTEEILLVVPPQHHLAERSHIHLREIAGEPLISLTSAYALQDLMENFCRQSGFTPNITFRVTNSATIHGLVRAGMGIAFIPAQSWWMRTTQDIDVLHIDEPSCQRMNCLAWRKDRYLSQMTQKFRQFVIENLAHELVSWLGARYSLRAVTIQESEMEEVIRRIYEEGLLQGEDRVSKHVMYIAT